MAGFRHRSRPIAWLIAALLLTGVVVVPSAAPADAATGLSTWTGGINLYRSGVYTAQKTWWYCTAADVQIMRNMVEHDDDHSTAAQRRYFDWMRKHNRYRIPVRAGIDPAGWTAGLRHFVDDRYRLVASTSFDGALRLAVTRMRLTNLPVALAVAHGNHGWVLHGFTATADPAATKRFTITSVRVTGPLYGLQSRNGYDMKPNTKLTPTQLKRFFTRWHYDPLPMIWDGLYVSIQPVPARSRTAERATADPSSAPSPSPSSVASPSVVPLLAPAAPSEPPPTTGAAGVAPSASPALVGTAVPTRRVGATSAALGPGLGLGSLLIGVTASLMLLAWRGRRSP